jgi:hypothetical protein
MGIINWCDINITKLKKSNKIDFIKGIPHIPKDMYYDNIPKRIETYTFRNEIPIEERSESLISFYSMDNFLFPRLNSIDREIKIFKEYAGIVGMDISICVTMLKPRQLHSILINTIYNCLIALKGIKIAINARIGDMTTYYLINQYPKDKTLVIGSLGCKGIFKEYGMIQLEQWLKLEPKNICIYGTICKSDMKRYSKFKRKLTIYLYHEHNKGKNKFNRQVFIIRSDEYTLNFPRQKNLCIPLLSNKNKTLL